MIKLSNITKKFENKIVLNKLSVNFEPNKINILSGPSGCGKTTLFNIISGIDKDFSGTLSGVPGSLGYLFQEDRLLPYYTVLDNVIFTLPESMDNKEKLLIASGILQKMELSDEKNTFPHELSGGMSRRAAIARAFSYPCELLLLDEPFNGLNIELKENVVQLMLESTAEQLKTIIIITHDLTVFDNIDGVNRVKMFE